MELPEGAPQRVTDSTDFELSPSFSADGKSMVFAAWNDESGGTIYRSSYPEGAPRAIYQAPTQLANPAFSSDGERIVFVKGSGANLRGEDLGSEMRHDLYVMPAKGGAPEFVVSTPNRGSNRRITRPVFGPEGKRIYYFEDLPETGGGERGSRTPQKTGLVSVALDGTDRRVHLSFRYAQEAIPNPQLTHVAFTELHNAYVIPMPAWGKTLDVAPGSMIPVAQLSWDGGEWVSWADDGETVTWSFGPEFHRAKIDDLEFEAEPAKRPEDEDEADPVTLAVTAKGAYEYASRTFDLEGLGKILAGLAEAKPKPKFEINVADEAPFQAWTSLKDWLEEEKLSYELAGKEDDADEADSEEQDSDSDEKAKEPETFAIDLSVPRAVPQGSIALVGARIITMKGDEVIEDGTIRV
jgi:hypothetical protein